MPGHISPTPMPRGAMRWRRAHGLPLDRVACAGNYREQGGQSLRRMAHGEGGDYVGDFSKGQGFSSQRCLLTHLPLLDGS